MSKEFLSKYTSLLSFPASGDANDHHLHEASLDAVSFPSGVSYSGLESNWLKPLGAFAMFPVLSASQFLFLSPDCSTPSPCSIHEAAQIGSSLLGANEVFAGRKRVNIFWRSHGQHSLNKAEFDNLRCRSGSVFGVTIIQYRLHQS